MQIKYMEKQIFCKRFEIKNLGEHRDLYLRSDALLIGLELLTDVDDFNGWKRN